MDGLRSLLYGVFECSYSDLQVLDGIGYDVGEIANELINDGVKPTLNRITSKVFLKGQNELEKALEEAIREREDKVRDLSPRKKGDAKRKKLEKEIAELKRLVPENDIGWHCNCLDTSIFFVANEEIYRKYLSGKLDEIEDHIGFSF